MWFNCLLVFGLSVLVCVLILSSQRWHVHVSGDTDLNAIQKVHLTPVPRIGGLAVFMGLLLGLLFAQTLSWVPVGIDMRFFEGLLLLGAIVLLVGLVEDITKRISPRVRLLVVAFAATLAGVYFQILVPRVDIIGIDWLLAQAMVAGIPVVALVFTVFAVSGISNALNIIDGLNGLASGGSALMFLTVAIVAYWLNDLTIVYVSGVMIAAIIGFMMFNYPKGRIFLGDGGAYFIGFMLAETVIALVARHAEVSAWFAIMVFALPLWETGFSMVRRVFIQKCAASSADRLHLHTLIYHRLVRVQCRLGQCVKVSTNKRNSIATCYLWVIVLFTQLMALLYYASTSALLIGLVCIVMGLNALYRALVKFNAPNCLKIKL